MPLTMFMSTDFGFSPPPHETGDESSWGNTFTEQLEKLIEQQVNQDGDPKAVVEELTRQLNLAIDRNNLEREIGLVPKD